MRKVDESRVANYIRKHSNYKKWLAFVLCLSLLTGTVTLYILNKPATAMTAEGADSLGVILDTLDSEGEAELIQDTLENKLAAEGEGSGEGGDGNLFDLGQGSGNNGEDGDDAAGGDGQDGDDAAKLGDTEETKDGQKSDDTALTEDKAAAEATSDEKSKEETTEEDELTQDVVLTVSYVDEDGESIADDKELSIEESFDPAKEAPSIEGYTFKEATFNSKAISKITVLKNDSDIKYYEVTFDNDETKEIKKDAAVVLTYIKDEEEVEVDASVTLTAKYVDKDGEDIQDSEEISFAKETSMNKDNAPEIDGYFFMKAVYDGQEIVKITPVEAETEVEAEDSDNEEDTTEETEEAKTVSVEGYEFTTADGDTVEITEDAEIEYTYVKASEETEFTFSDSKVTVTATINGKNVFPEGILLKAAEVTKDSSSYNYDAYMNALNENAETIAEEAGQEQANEFTENNTLLYDIAFVYEGKEVQPKEGTVTISINFKKNQLSEDLSAASKDDVTVVHLPIKEEVKEENEIVNTEDASDITASDIEVITLTDATAAVEGNEQVEFETEGFSIFAVLAYQQHAAGTDTYETVLGDAVNFAVVAKEVYQKSHAQNNFAAVRYKQDGNVTGNNITNPEEQTFIAADVDGTIRIDGFPAYFMVPKEHESKIGGNARIYWDTSYSYEQLKNIVEDMIDYTKAASKDLAGRTESTFEESEINGKTVLDFSSKADGTYYLNVDKDFYEKYMSSEDKLQIKKKSGQTIVFNVTYAGENGEFKFFKYSVDNGKGFLDAASMYNAGYSDVTRTIIWNFINSTKVTSEGSVVGVFISGKENATWENISTCAGWVVFDNVTLPGSGEWHNTYDKVKKISGTAQLQAYKTIDGEPSKVSGFEFGVFKRKTDDSFEDNPFQTVKNDGHDVVFSTIEYGEDNSKQNDPNYELLSLDSDNQQVFIYKIKETATKDNLIKDETEYYAKVTVEKVLVLKDGNGNPINDSYIKVSNPEYYTDANCENLIGTIPTFNNVSKYAEAPIKVKKNFIGGVWTPGKTFTFEIAPVGDVEIPITEEKEKIVNGNGAKSQEVNFGTIKYSQAGEYRYVISEIEGTADDIQYDDKRIYVKVIVDPNMDCNVYYYSDDQYSSIITGDAIAFNNLQKASLVIEKKWTRNGTVLEPQEAEFTQPIFVKIYRTYDTSAGTYGEDFETIDGVQYEPMKWKLAGDVYKPSEDGDEMLGIYSNNGIWQIKLSTDKVHPSNYALSYRYYVREYLYDSISRQYVEKNDLVVYKASNEETSHKWNDVYAFGSTDSLSNSTLYIYNELGGNVLPSTGGMGDLPYMATGVGTAVAGLLGAGAYSKKKKRDDEE